MSEIQLAPSYVLTTDHPSSSYGKPVMLRRATGDVYGPGDIIKPYGNWTWMPAAAAVSRLAKIKGLEADPLVQSFVGLLAAAT